MKFIVNAGKLLKALDNVQGVVDKRNATPILSNVRISVEGSRLIINATDMDLDILEILHMEQIISTGATTAPANMLFETLKRLPAASSVEFSLEEEKLSISCGKFRSTLNCLPVEEFPVIQTNDLPNLLKVAVGDLKKIIEKTKFAISLDETRYYLNGVYLHTTENEAGNKVLRSVSTDGHRLALADAVFNSDATIEQGVIIPKKAVDEISKIIDNVEDKEVEISCNSSRICFKFSNIILTSKLIDGSFPNYNRVIPQGNDKILEVNRNDFINAIDIVSMYSDDKLKIVQIDCVDGKLTLKANKAVGLAEQELDILRPMEDISISFNARYLKDVCSLIKGESVFIHLFSATTPVLIKKIDVCEELFVIMPMRL